MAASVLDTYALSSLNNANSYLGLTADGGAIDTYIEYIINRASDMIEDALHNKIMARRYIKERYDGKGQENIYFKQFPVVSVNLDELAWVAGAKTVTRKDGGSFIIDGFKAGEEILIQGSDLNNGLLTIAAGGVAALVITFAAAMTIVTDAVDNNVILSHFNNLWVDDAKVNEGSYEVHSNHIHYPQGFSEGHGNVRMTYYGGNILLPDDVERLCLRLVKRIYNKNEGVKAEKLGPYSVTHADEGKIKDEIRQELSRFMNMAV